MNYETLRRVRTQVADMMEEHPAIERASKEKVFLLDRIGSRTLTYLRCGKWHDVCVSSSGVTFDTNYTCNQLPKVAVCAFNGTLLDDVSKVIEILYIIDGKGYMIINGEEFFLQRSYTNEIPFAGSY